MVKYTVYRVSIQCEYSSGVVTLCRKNGQTICRLAWISSLGEMAILWENGTPPQMISAKCGVLIGCHAVEIDQNASGSKLVVRIPRNSGFTLNGMT